MFSLIRLAASLVGLAVITLATIYFLPHEMKLKAFGVIGDVLPDSLKNAAEDIILTPPESREKIIQNIEDNLQALREAAPLEAEHIIKETEALLADLKAKNDEQSIAEIVKMKIADQLVSQQLGTTTPSCEK
jgi:hypothetical protein